MPRKTALLGGKPASVRILSLAAAALAAFAWVAGAPRKAERPIPAVSVALLAELCGGIESASYQVIANPILNEALDAYGRAAERYDVSEWHEVFAAYFDGVARNLLDDALFFDVDDPGRKRLGLGEGIDNAFARSIRDTAIGPAVAADGRLVWLGLSGGGKGPDLMAARLVKRLADGSPIGVLVLIPEARKLAAAFGQTLGEESVRDPRAFAFLVGSGGTILAGSRPEGIGLPLESAYPGGGRLLVQETLGIGEGSVELRVSDRREPFVFEKVPGTEWTLVVSAADDAEMGFAALRMVALLALAALMAFALKRSMTEGTAASAVAVIAVAAGTARPYQPLTSPPAGTESMAAGEASGTAPAWFRELAPREKSIVLLLAAGNSNKEIASKLGIAEQTVKNRLGLIYERLGVRDRVSAALIVSRARLRDDGSRLFTANSGE